MPRWLLPESISDVLPSEARRVEELRRRLLDLYRCYGYELVMPPLVEHLDALLTGSGQDLALRTFQLVDQLSGRTLGVRADMTPQVARIDAHLLNRSGVARLCYAGPVLHARPAGLFATREPLQIGAEVYGHAGIEADLEILELIVESLRAAGVRRVRLDLCHEAVVPALMASDPAFGDRVAVDEVYALLRQKDIPGLAQSLQPVAPRLREALLALATLYVNVDRADGGEAAIARLRAALPALPAVAAALEQLARLVRSPLWERLPEVSLSIDLADLRARYHTGVSFAAYVEELPNAIARGGRYDDVGRAFGRARPATGFSLELRELASLGAEPEPRAAIQAPWSDDAALLARIAELRAAGEIVVRALPGHEREQQEFACDRELALVDGAWTLRPL